MPGQEKTSGKAAGGRTGGHPSPRESAVVRAGWSDPFGGMAGKIAIRCRRGRVQAKWTAWLYGQKRRSPVVQIPYSEFSRLWRRLWALKAWEPDYPEPDHLVTDHGYESAGMRVGSVRHGFTMESDVNSERERRAVGKIARFARKWLARERWDPDDEVRGYIRNAWLTEKDVPPPEAALDAIWRFASTFGDHRYMERCGDLANRTAEEYQRTGRIPAALGLSDLRACLYFEQRRWRHLEGNGAITVEGREVPAGASPAEKDLRYFRALVDAIRTKVAAGTEM